MAGQAEHGEDLAGERVADAKSGNWVDRHAPARLRPFLRLARFDRPIGAWLLMWPCWWSATLAAVAERKPHPDPWHLALFLIGALAMRGAGCTYNDLLDRDIDAKVERTRSRPLPSGQVTAGAALLFMLALCLVGLVVLLQLDSLSIKLGLASLTLVAVYPLMKRITHWPQAVLGLAFGWGALIGWTAATGALGTPALVLYAGTIAWIIGYDTIYAHQDKEDDAIVGVRSTALRFGAATPSWLIGLYGLAWLAFLAAAALAGAGIMTYMGLLAVGGHMFWQVATLDIDDPANCLERFRSNHLLGFLLFAGLLADAAFSAMLPS